jgi:polysaccharide export outer membrane protein
MYNPSSFTAFGAANKAGRYTFDLPKLYLTDALSEAGGLVDMQADTAGVYLFRSLPRDQAASLFPGLAMPANPLVPVIFRVDLSQANGFVLAKETEMRNKDLILATNSKGTQLLKMFGILRGLSAPVGDIRGNLRSN